MPSSKSNLEDELDELRNRGLAKSHRDKYRDSSGTILTPEQVEHYLAQIRTKEKGRATITPPTNLTSGDLNDWYNQQRKLELEARKKRQEAEQMLHKYRSKFDETQVKSPGGGSGGIDKDSDLEFTLSDGGFQTVAEEISKFDKNAQESEYIGKVWTPPRKSVANDDLEKEVGMAEDAALEEELVVPETEQDIQKQVLELHKDRYLNTELDEIDESNMTVEGTTNDETVVKDSESVPGPGTVIPEIGTDGTPNEDIVTKNAKESRDGDEHVETVGLETTIENSDDTESLSEELKRDEDEEESSLSPTEAQGQEETISAPMEEIVEKMETLSIEEDFQNVTEEEDKRRFDECTLEKNGSTSVSTELEEATINDSLELSQAPNLEKEPITHNVEALERNTDDGAKVDNFVSRAIAIEEKQHSNNESIDQEAVQDSSTKESCGNAMGVAMDKNENLKDDKEDVVVMGKGDDTKEKTEEKTENGSHSGEGENNESGSGKNVYRNWVCDEPGSKYRPDTNRYHLYVSYACPWAHRTTMVRALKGLEDVIGITYVHPTWQYTNPSQDEHRGWVFGSTGKKSFTNTSGVGSFPSSWGEVDPIMNAKSIREIYEKVNDTIGKYTVPILWDKSLNTIVSNESAEIIRMLNFEFNDLAKHPEMNLYPEELEDEIDEVNAWVYPAINNGVYRCGLASNQEMYDSAIDELTEAFDRVNGILKKQLFLLGDSITEADVRLFVTLLRFDEVYNVYFKTNTRSVSSCKAILKYVKRIYNMKGVKETCRMDMIKAHYFTSHVELNKYSIIPRGDDFMKLLNSD